MEPANADTSHARRAKRWARWHEYERRKDEWRRAHPEATEADYDAAMKVILGELGL